VFETGEQERLGHGGAYPEYLAVVPGRHLGVTDEGSSRVISVEQADESLSAPGQQVEAEVVREALAGIERRDEVADLLDRGRARGGTHLDARHDLRVSAGVIHHGWVLTGAMR
jgi:hypothetical protein